MARYLLLLFLAIPLLEIAVFIEVGSRIGLWPTLGAIIATAVLGSAVLSRQGRSAFARAQRSLARHELPVAEVFDGLCLVLAGALLLTPGFVTDTVGALLLIPALRGWLRGYLWRRLAASGEVWIDGERVRPGGAAGAPPVIEGEFRAIDEDGDRTGDGGP